MSILVKGMTMPKNCVDCPLFESLYHFHGCHAKPESFKDRDMWNFAVGDRPTWCPLAEVPAPHGRLIDADALELEAQKRLLICNKYGNQFQKPYDVMNAIVLAPTIIEAEGET